MRGWQPSLFGKRFVNARCKRFVAQLRHAQTHGDIRRRADAAEAERFFGDPVADGVGADRYCAVRLLADNGAAAKTDGNHIRHPEVGAHAADGTATPDCCKTARTALRMPS